MDRPVHVTDCAGGKTDGSIPAALLASFAQQFCVKLSQVHGLQFLDRYRAYAGPDMSANELQVALKGFGANIDSSPIAQPAIKKLTESYF